MAENVILSIQLNGAEAALQQLTQLDNVVNRLKANRNVNIKVSASGITSAANQAAKLDTNLTNAGKAAQQIGTTGAQSIGNAGTALTKASRNAESFHLGLGNVLGTMLKFRAASMAVNFAFSAFSSALNEMKAVDTELVNIRKVTGYTNAEIEKLSKTAFSLATNYGRSASEVLEASTTFARAGYTEQIEQLSELSLLLQNVGDLNAEDASKFLIATDKAYKLGGSYEELMAIIDGLDNITNKNATDMQKMTEGMTVAGSVFAESGESVEVFAALLGTATSATQRSGSEVGRALRTILMNLRQIRGKTEDGELIDGESIAAASKALKDYAGISTMENGELRKASDILGDLAEKWDTLTETQQAAIAEAVAGKRQANVLMALMGDWGSYEKMLGEYENAAGTAAKENEIYMDSWEAKTKQVSAAWNELIASIVDTDGIKGVLDLAIDALDLIEDIVQSDLFQSLLDGIKTVIDAAIAGIDYVFEKASDVADFLTDTSGQRIEEAQADAESKSQEANNLLEQYNTQFGDGSRYSELVKNVENLTDQQRIELVLLELQREELEKQIELEEEAAKKAADRVESEKRQNIANRNLAAGTTRSMQLLSDANFKFQGSGDVNEYLENIEKALQRGKEFYNQLIQLRQEGGELTEGEIAFVEAYEYAVNTYLQGGNAVEMYAKIQAAYYRSFGDSWEESFEKANDAADLAVKHLKELLDEIPEVKSIDVRLNFSINNLAGEILGKFSQYASGTQNARGGPALVNEKGPEIIAANGLAWIAGGGKPTVTMLPHGATVLTAQQTRQATGGRRISGIPAFADGKDSKYKLINPLDSTPWDVVASAFVNAANAEADKWSYTRLGPEDAPTPAMRSLGGPPQGRNVKVSGSAVWGVDEEGNPVYKRGTPLSSTKIYDPTTGKNLYERTGGGAGGGPSGPTPPNFKALEDDLTKLLKNLDAQAKLAENEEDFLKAMMVYGDAQSAIAELLEQYRANGYAEDSDEVLRLANLGYDYAAKQLGGYDKLQQSLIDALNGLTKATDDANELQERREAVDKAREALQNAERQRTVRIFNPVTGQWEWVANAADVQKAQEKLQSAEESLRKEELSQAVDAIKNASPADLGNMTLSPAILEALFGGTPEQQTAFLNALGAATGGANWLSSSEAQTPWNQGNSIGTQYNLNGITLTEAQASGMTIKDLIAMLQGLKIM